MRAAVAWNAGRAADGPVAESEEGIDGGAVDERREGAFATGQRFVVEFCGTELAVGAGEDEQAITHDEDAFGARAGDDERSDLLMSGLNGVARKGVYKHTAAFGDHGDVAVDGEHPAILRVGGDFRCGELLRGLDGVAGELVCEDAAVRGDDEDAAGEIKDEVVLWM